MVLEVSGEGRYMAPMWIAMPRPKAAVPCPWPCMCTGVIAMRKAAAQE